MNRRGGLLAVGLAAVVAGVALTLRPGLVSFDFATLLTLGIWAVALVGVALAAVQRFDGEDDSTERSRERASGPTTPSRATTSQRRWAPSARANATRPNATGSASACARQRSRRSNGSRGLARRGRRQTRRGGVDRGPRRGGAVRRRRRRRDPRRCRP
ncbi:hypothetical protein ACFQL4_14845 [Halosimplex aquaticum]